VARRALVRRLIGATGETRWKLNVTGLALAMRPSTHYRPRSFVHRALMNSARFVRDEPDVSGLARPDAKHRVGILHPLRADCCAEPPDAPVHTPRNGMVHQKTNAY
jgi:hypothetical protein